MSLFSRARMTAIALAALTLPLAVAPAAEARDRNEGGSHRSFSSHSTSRADRGRDDDWRRRHHVRRDRDDARDVIRGTTSMRTRAWTLRRGWDQRNWSSGNWDRARWDRGNWNRGTWDRNRQAGWDRRFDGPRRDDDAWRNRTRPYYEGAARPYYAGGGSYDRGGLGNNFYGGSISAYEDPGNGNYFYFDSEYGDGGGSFPMVGPRYGAKVISVTPETESASCSWEAGVCVIRP